MVRSKSMWFALCVLLAACGKDDKKSEGAAAGGGSCGPLEVTIDGKKVEGLTHGLAITEKTGSDLSQQVQVFNHDQVTCEQVLNKSGREITNPDEIDVRANAGTATMSRGVGMDSHSQLGVEVKLIGKAPSKPGDKVTLCAPKTTFKPTIGTYKDKSVTVSGTFEGSYCGVLEH